MNVITHFAVIIMKMLKITQIKFFFRYIVNTEGARALFKGLGPNIVGVAPSRAIYFCAYSQTKASLSTIQ